MPPLTLTVSPEMATLLKVEPGSIAILFPKEGTLDIEILPPPSTELQESVRASFPRSEHEKQV